MIRRALGGDAASMKALVDRLSPVVARRVAATLWLRAGQTRAIQDAADMNQEVLLSLFQSDGKALRAWDPGRGMSLEGFVGLLAQHQVISRLRSGRISAWREESTDHDELVRVGAQGATPESVAASRESLRALLDRVRETLSPRGLELFQRIIVDEEPTESLMATLGLTRAAIYQWKSRLLRVIRTLAEDGERPTPSKPGARSAVG